MFNIVLYRFFLKIGKQILGAEPGIKLKNVLAFFLLFPTDHCLKICLLHVFVFWVQVSLLLFIRKYFCRHWRFLGSLGTIWFCLLKSRSVCILIHIVCFLEFLLHDRFNKIWYFVLIISNRCFCNSYDQFSWPNFMDIL